MMYDNNDTHILIKQIKLKGWEVFEIYYARPSFKNGINSGWWIDCGVSYDTEHYNTHKLINNKFLGTTIKESIKTIGDDKFPLNKIK